VRAWALDLPTPAATAAAGERLGRAVDGPLHLGLLGALGAGKTGFVQGLARGLGVAGPVTSPTFALVEPHPGRVALLHVDLYRVEAQELPHIGLDEQAWTWPGVVAVEWADRAPDLLRDDRLEITLLDDGGGGRRMEVRAGGPDAAAVLARWAGAGA
jgi:tRNA threonylcarbamoyladenosine biosynthesis protein TsaE